MLKTMPKLGGSVGVGKGGNNGSSGGCGGNVATGGLGRDNEDKNGFWKLHPSKFTEHRKRYNKKDINVCLKKNAWWILNDDEIYNLYKDLS